MASRYSPSEIDLADMINSLVALKCLKVCSILGGLLTVPAKLNGDLLLI